MHLHNMSRKNPLRFSPEHNAMRCALPHSSSRRILQTKSQNFILNETAPDSGDTGSATLDAKRQCRNYPSSDSGDTIVVDENGELSTQKCGAPIIKCKAQQSQQPKNIQQPKTMVSNHKNNDGSNKDKSLTPLDVAVCPTPRRFHRHSRSILETIVR